MSARKTVKVARVLELANTYLERSDDDRQAERWGIASLLEQVLHETNTYAGFNYLEGAEAVHAGTYDDSRRHYYAGKIPA